MKRKVNLVGINTLTVSLPSTWTKKNNIKKGDELEISESAKTLVLSTSVRHEKKEIAISIDEYGTMSGRVLGALYKAGYDKIRVNFSDSKKIEIVEKELGKGFMGMDIIHQSKNYCILESLAATEEEALDNSIRRVFRLLIENANDACTAIKDQNLSELEEVAKKDRNVNKFADFCRRLLNKFANSNLEKTNLTYSIIEKLENMGDDYRNVCLYIAKNRVKCNAQSLKMFSETNAFLNQFYELYYNFSEKKFAEFGSAYDKLIIRFDEVCESQKDKNLIVLIKLQAIGVAIFNLNGPLITSRF